MTDNKEVQGGLLLLPNLKNKKIGQRLSDL